MRYARFLALAFLAGALSFQAIPAAAQSRLAGAVPAEIPPASFTGRQYVDSRGCVFVRAGIDGNVDWVPRVTRSRQHICGAQPTFASAPPAAAPAPKPAPRVAQIAPAPAPAATPAPRAAAPRVVQTGQPMTTVASVPARPVVRSTPAPTRQVVRAAPAPVRQVVRAAPVIAPTAGYSAGTTTGPLPASVRQAAMADCQSGGSVLRRYSHGGKNYAVLCGPQFAANAVVTRHATTMTGATARRADASALSGSTRIVPRHVYEARDDQVVKVPKGYRAAFDDDRLNRKRANQSIDGYRDTQLYWTNTTPRRLINASTRRDVTAKYPRLIYPYTDYATQNAAISTKGTVTAKATRAAPAPRVAVKATPRAPTAAAGGRYVQVGTFGVPANAERTARRLQSLGLPVRYGAYSKGGKSYRIVMAGPFARQSDLNAALSAARRAGFSDAFVR